MKDSIVDKLAKAVIHVESGGNPNAHSGKGAHGLMQIMPDTGKELAGQIGEMYDPTNSEQNVRLGSLYLEQLLYRYEDDLKLALAAYNAGLGHVDHWIKEWGTNWDVISSNLQKLKQYKETTDYVLKVLKFYGEN